MDNNRIKNGYTLVEILVGIAIFALLVAGPTGLFISSLRSQNRILGLREVVDSSSYLLEYMSRTLRMAQKDKTGVCISAGANYEYPVGHNRQIRFLNYKGNCHEFSVTGGGKLREKSPIGAFPVDLTSSDLKITDLQFEISGGDQNDDLQPRVTILLEITKAAIPGFPEVKVQTTISQRNLDVHY